MRERKYAKLLLHVLFIQSINLVHWSSNLAYSIWWVTVGVQVVASQRPIKISFPVLLRQVGYLESF